MEIYERKLKKKRNNALKKSQYRCVYWTKNKRKWRARLCHGGRRFSNGCFDNLREAAHAVNLKCDELGIPRKNPELGDPPEYIKKVIKEKAKKFRKENVHIRDMQIDFDARSIGKSVDFHTKKCLDSRSKYVGIRPTPHGKWLVVRSFLGVKYSDGNAYDDERSAAAASDRLVITLQEQLWQQRKESSAYDIFTMSRLELGEMYKLK